MGALNTDLVREKPGGREKANRGNKEKEEEEGEEEKDKRKSKEEKKKMHQASTAARLCQNKNSPPQALPGYLSSVNLVL